MNTSENNSVARERSRVIILKSRLNSTGHSAYMHEVPVTFLIVRPVYPMIDDSLCTRAFSKLEVATTQRQHPSVILHSHLTKNAIKFYFI